jgi:hypothetical protein
VALPTELSPACAQVVRHLAAVLGKLPHNLLVQRARLARAVCALRIKRRALAPRLQICFRSDGDQRRPHCAANHSAGRKRW